MPELPGDQRFEVVPDWVCEILTPATATKDRDIKMPLYLRRGVRHAWLVDPDAQTLEAFEAGEGTWRQVGRATGDDQVSLSPFEVLSFPVSELWDW
jgi:Uma2 family endonuclease